MAAGQPAAPPSTPVQSGPPPALSPLLERCERWFQLAGRTVHRGVASAPPAFAGAPTIPFAVLAVQQGSFPVIVRVASEDSSIVSVFINIPIPPEVRQRLRSAEPPLLLRLLLSLRKELLSSGRCGFNIMPSSATSADQVEMVAINQEICVAGGWGAEITRLLDATVEVATAAAKVVGLYAPVAGGAPSTSATSSPRTPSEGPGSMFR